MKKRHVQFVLYFDQFSDPNTLVETVSFASQNKLQPFMVSITTSSVLLMDFHCHLTKQEVCGYLGGSWDNNTQSELGNFHIKIGVITNKKKYLFF